MCLLPVTSKLLYQGSTLPLPPLPLFVVLTEENKANRTEQDRTEGTVVATAVCLSSQLTPPSPRGSTGERGGCQQKVFECGFVCQRTNNREGESVHVLLWKCVICAPMYSSLPCGQGRAAQGGGHLTGHRWQQQTGTVAA